MYFLILLTCLLLCLLFNFFISYVFISHSCVSKLDKSPVKEKFKNRIIPNKYLNTKTETMAINGELNELKKIENCFGNGYSRVFTPANREEINLQT